MLRRLPTVLLGLSLLCLGTGCGSSEASAQAASAASAFEEDASPEGLTTVALRWLFGVGMGHRVQEGALKIYYLEPISELQARAVGRYLRKAGLHDDNETAPRLVQIRKHPALSAGQHPSYELRISSGFSRREHIDSETRATYQLLALSAEGALFGGSPVRLTLCDPLLRPLLVLRPRLGGLGHLAAPR